MHAPKMGRRTSRTQRGGASYKINGRRARILRSTATPIKISRKVSIDLIFPGNVSNYKLCNLLMFVKASLLGRLRINKGRKPMVVKAGFLSVESKQESIVALTEDWSLICFDEGLNKKWEVWLGHVGVSSGRKDIMYDHIDLFISPVELARGDRGSIIVVGSIIDKTSTKQRWFAAYGVSGTNGKVRWRYSSSIEGERKSSCTNALGQTFLEKALPFSWSEQTDNRITGVHFEDRGGSKLKHVLLLYQSSGITGFDIVSGNVLCKEEFGQHRTFFFSDETLHKIYYNSANCSLSWTAVYSHESRFSSIDLCDGLEQSQLVPATTPLVASTVHGTRVYTFFGNGVVHAMNTDAQVLWKTATQSTWETPPELGRFVPSIKVLDARADGSLFQRLSTTDLIQYLVCVGTTKLTVLNLENGQVESVLTLPYPPLVEVILGDFNHDRVEDVILITQHGTLGIGAKKTHAGAMRLLLVTLFVFVVAMIALITSINDGHED